MKKLLLYILIYILDWGLLLLFYLTDAFDLFLPVSFGNSIKNKEFLVLLELAIIGAIISIIILAINKWLLKHDLNKKYFLVTQLFFYSSVVSLFIKLLTMITFTL